MNECSWCGKPNAKAYTHGLLFCKRCYPVMKVRRTPLNHILVEKLQKIAGEEEKQPSDYRLTNPNTDFIKQETEHKETSL